MEKKYLIAFLFTFIFIMIGCKKENTITENEELPIEEKIVGKYDGKLEVYYYYHSNGETHEGRKTPTVVEIEKHGSDYDWDFFVDGNWELSLNKVKEYDGTLYFNVNSNTGRFADSGADYTVEGYTKESQYHGSFNSNTDRFQIGYIFKNITPSQGYDIIILYEGYLR